jgi:hypothetical protein
MPNFQQTVNYDYGFGIAGEIVRDGPLRALPGYINSAAPANNGFGRVFTLNGDGKTVGAGGTGAIWGILANPKQHVSMGDSVGPLDPVFVLPNNVTADFVQMGKIVCPLFGSHAAVAGLQLQYATATGLISIPATAGTPDSGNVLFNALVEAYGQTSQGGALILARVQI